MKNIKFLSAAALLATLFIGGQVASAEDGIREEDLTIGASSLVELATSTEPGEVLPPDEGPSTGPYRPVGILGITSATNLLFPQITLNGMIQTVDAQYVLNDKDKTEVPAEKKYLTMVKPDADGKYTTEQLDKAYAPGYSVVDKRGTGAGWTLSAKLSHFVKLDATGAPLAEDSEDYRVLKGTRIDFPAVDGITVAEANPTPEERVNTVAKTVAAGEAAAKNKLHGATVTFPAAVTSVKNLSIAGQDTNGPSIAANTVLTATNKPLFNATAGKGIGKWEVNLGGANTIKLTAPAGNLADTYTAIITYSIASTPTPGA
ncbi:WxL domain-containing protein [Vagococcus sp.]|uniref:WxL domain-containing protein n=1 Tax=Vagococcus sp. TaxID=1933889 RepID=UPI003F9CBC9D